MTPLRLTLRGFAGIKAGMGRDEFVLDLEALDDSAEIVALAGPNGAGKTTVIDNLHPYRLMPSRAAGLSPAGFSFYEHLAAAEALKELDWEHQGVRYRSTLLFRVNGRRATDAYVYEVHDGALRPVTLPDGTVSNGSTTTYDRIIEALLGSAETFFTAAFSAQNRRTLASYGNAEVKGLMADLLGLESIRASGERAGQVHRLLKVALEERRAQLKPQSDAAEALAAAQAAQVALDAAATSSAEDLERARAKLEQAQLALGSAREAARTQEATVARRAVIGTELAAEQDGQKRADGAYRERTAALKQRRAEIDQAAQRARADLERRQRRLEEERRAATAVVADEARVAAAMAEQPALDDAVRRAGEALLVHEGRARQCAALRGEAAVARERIRGVEQQAGAAVLRTRELRQRHQLTEEVPCHGTDLQGACKLLADACAARPLIPSAEADVTRLGEERTALQGQIRTLETQLAALGDADAELRKAQTALQTAQQRQAAALQLVAKAAGIESAKQGLVAIDSDASSIGVAAQQIEDDLRVAQQRLDEETAAAEQAFEEAGAQRRARIERLKTELAALPAPDVEAQQRAAKALEEAQRRLAAAETLQRQAAAKQAAGRTQIAVLTAASAEAQRLADEVAALEGEIGWWALLVKALGNDGVIALCIDDAGPALAQLTNELLQSCYGPRFTVSIRTQLETAKGGQREGFDVMVFDALTGTAKSVTLMSGGERVWINECLTRAVALYLSQTSARHYETLFCDETDGALDAERKRMFMQMKREVLRIGGYRREYFISQSPELAGMADAVIDVGSVLN